MHSEGGALGIVDPLCWQVLMGLAALSVVEEITGAEDGGMEAAEVVGTPGPPTIRMQVREVGQRHPVPLPLSSPSPSP